MIEEGISQRDAFWKGIYEQAKNDRDIIVLSADMGAPALDAFKRDFPGQYVATGIAEQNTILVAAGLSLLGKKVFAYAISSFVAINCLEKIKVQSSIMGIPITIVGVGAGMGYPDSGPTHHAIEDFAVMRAFPGIDIFNVSDSHLASQLAQSSILQRSRYIRLDRQILPHLEREDGDFQRGYSLYGPKSELMIVATGVMSHTALDVAKELSRMGVKVAVMDLFKFPIEKGPFLKSIHGVRKMITLEEHFLPGGMGSSVSEVITDYHLGVKLKRLGMPHELNYCYQYGGRQSLQGYYGLGYEQIKNEIMCYFKGPSAEK